MKQAIIFFLVALIFGAGINGLLMNASTYDVKPGVMTAGPSAAGSGMKRGENMMPDVKVVDAYRRVNFMHQCEDRDNTQQTDFPMSSIQY